MKKLYLLTLTAGLLATIAAPAAEPAIRYVDAATLNVIGKALPTEAAFNRIDTTRYVVPKETRVYSYHPTGLAVVFSTNSPLISARWETSGRNASNNMAAMGQKGLDLYIRQGGEWIYAGVGKPKMDGKNKFHEYTIIKNMESGEKECLLYLPLYDVMSKLEIGVAEGCSISPMENPFRHKIVVHGSSITHGISASRPSMCYPARLERNTGLYFVNLGFSGQCKLQPEFGTYLADVEADAFIFDTFSNPSAKMIDDRFDAFVDAIRKTHPTTPLIFLQTILRETANFDPKIRKFEDEKRAAAELQVRERMKKDPNIYFVDPGNLLGTDHLGTIDGTHPTDLGFERMVNAIQPRITEILAKYNIR